MVTEIELNWTRPVESQDVKNSRATAIKEQVIKLQHIYDTKEISQSIKVSIFSLVSLSFTIPTQIFYFLLIAIFQRP